MGLLTPILGGLASALLALAYHPGPSIWGEIVLGKEEMVLLVEGAADRLTTNLGLHRKPIGPSEPPEVEKLKNEISEFCTERLLVKRVNAKGKQQLSEVPADSPSRIVLFESEPSGELRLLLEEFGLTSVLLSPCEMLCAEERQGGANYFSVMRRNTERLLSALAP